jgi:hypothetical protein
VFVCVCVCALPLCVHPRGRAGTGGIYSSAATVGWQRVRFALFIGRSRALAAGATWTNRTTSAPWAARYGHTSVVDAAGAIYVIGGYNGNTYFNEVLRSTDGGADRTKSEVLGGYWVGTRVLEGVLGGIEGVLTGTEVHHGDTEGWSRGT